MKIPIPDAALVHNLITLFVHFYTAIDNDKAEGGTDAETDASLVARYYDFLRNPGTSGNAAHYRQWAREVDGVGDVQVMPLWGGPGTVKVLLVSPNNQPVDNTVVSNCAAHIEKNRPVGPTVTVMSAAGLSIDVSASVVIKSSTTAKAVQSAFETALSAYLQKLTAEAYAQAAVGDYEVTYNRVGYILLDIDGVVDFTELTVNGGESDIVIAADEVPVPGNVEVTV